MGKWPRRSISIYTPYLLHFQHDLTPTLQTVLGMNECYSRSPGFVSSIYDINRNLHSKSYIYYVPATVDATHRQVNKPVNIEPQENALCLPYVHRIVTDRWICHPPIHPKSPYKVGKTALD